MLGDGHGRLDWLIGECEGLRQELQSWEAAFSVRWIQGCCLVDGSENVWIGDWEEVQVVLIAERDGTDAAEASVAS